MAETRPDVEGPGADGGDFVVIERLETLKARQDELEEGIRRLRAIVDYQEEEIKQMEKIARSVDNLWKVFWYSLLLILPAVFAFVVDYKFKQSFDDFLSLPNLLVGISIFVGIPSFITTLYTSDMFEDEAEQETEGVATEDEFESDEEGGVTEAEDIGSLVEKDINNNDTELADDNEVETQ